jgi:hypothetical protein
MTSEQLAAAEYARLDSYILNIAEEARGAAAVDAVGAHRFGSKGALVVFASGQWHDFSSGAHGFNALQLIEHLHPGTDAVALARSWLDRHPGAGGFVRGDSEPANDFAEIEATAFIKTLYERAGAVDDTPGYIYLTQTRGLPLSPEDAALLRWAPNYRGDEGALIAPVTDNDGKLVKLLLTYITPDGLKSPHTPCRITLRGAKGSGMLRFGTPGPKAIEVEGLEKGLAARAGGAEYVVVSGGAGNLGRAPLPPIVGNVVIARDDDPAGSEADQALWRGVARRMSQGLKVAVTERPNTIAAEDAPALKDLDDVWRFDPELVPILLNGATLEHGRLGDAVDGAILDAASRFDAIELGRARKGIAGLLGIPLGSLDDQREQIIRERIEKGEKPADDGLPGRPLTFDEIELWPTSVNGAELLTELSDTIGKYVIMDAPQRDAAALGAVFTHSHDLRDTAPIFFAVSPTRRCGKTRLERVIKRLAPKPVLTSHITPAALARTIEKHRPTVLIDEFDATIADDQGMAESLRGQLNSSFDRDGANIIKCVSIPGGGIDEREFSTWAQTWIAGIKKIPETVEDRSVVLRLKRKLPGEKVTRFRGRDGGELNVLKRKAARFVADNEQRLRDIEPDMPEALNAVGDRAPDAWEPLIAIADVAGGDWPKRARNVALTLSGVNTITTTESDVDLELLSDIAQIFDACDAFAPTAEQLKIDKHIAALALGALDRGEEQTKRLPRRIVGLGGEQLTNALATLVEREWPTLDKGKPIRPRQLAKLLRAYGVISQPLRDGVVVFRGYPRDRLEDAIGRYLISTPPSSGDSSRHTVAGLEEAGENEVFETVTENARNTSKNAGNPSNSGGRDDVTRKTQDKGPLEKGDSVEGPKKSLSPSLPHGARGRKPRPATPPDTTASSDTTETAVPQ